MPKPQTKGLPSDGIVPPGDNDSIAKRVMRGEPRGPGGHIPTFEPTPDQRYTVLVMSANGVKRDVIAATLRIHKQTLDKYFRKEIREGRSHVTARIGSVVVREALNGNIGAARYWLDRFGGPQWQLPKDAPNPGNYSDDGASGDEPAVRFYLPENGRNKPEPEPPAPIIDHEVDKAA